MNEQEIKDGAPSGASHYFGHLYYKYDYLKGWLVYMGVFGWCRVKIGISTELKPL